MSENPSQIQPEFVTVEAAEAYDHWLRAKVRKSLDDERPTTSHQDVMAAAWKMIDAKRDIIASDSMAD